MRNTDDAHETKKNTVRRERTQLTDWLAVGCVQNDRVNSHTKRKAEEKKNKQKNNLKTLIIVFESYSAIDKSRLVVVCVLNTLTYVARAISCLDIDIALGYFISHTHIQIYFEYMLTARRIRSGRWRFAYIVTVTAVREKYSNISNGMRIGMSVCVCVVLCTFRMSLWHGPIGLDNEYGPFVALATKQFISYTMKVQVVRVQRRQVVIRIDCSCFLVHTMQAQIFTFQKDTIFSPGWRTTTTKNSSLI